MLQGRELVEFARYVRPMKVGLVTFFLASRTLAHLCVFCLPEYPLRQVVIFHIHPRRSSVSSPLGPATSSSLFLDCPHPSEEPLPVCSPHPNTHQDASHPTARIRGDNTYNTRLYAAPQALTHSLRDSVCLPPHHNTSRPRSFLFLSPSPFTPFLSLRCSCACPLSHSPAPRHPPSILLAVSSINSSIRSSRTPFTLDVRAVSKTLASASL